MLAAGLLRRPLEVVSEHVVDRLLADRDPVLDAGAEVDAAPDAGVADVVLQVLDPVEVTITEARQAGDREVDLARSPGTRAMTLPRPG